ncbi:fasciclin arabinogalactan protein [Salix suchowensis]|nr:fasciclin arabinogalactan protein [Salix suchowensis]
MAATKILLSLLSLFSFLPSSFSIPTETLREAAVTLSNSGYLSMSLTLPLVSNSLLPHTPSLTIFSPCDTAFTQAGQPPLSILRLHFSPLSFPLNSLESLSLGAKIPTLFPNHSLTITSTGYDISLNGVKIRDSPVYDDGSLVILGVDRFFDPGFGASGQNLGCSVKVSSDCYSYNEASRVLKSKGYSVMASFLDLQLMAGFKDKTALTIFAPVDEVIKAFLGDLSEYSSMFRKHVVPCKIMWGDLVNFDDGVVLETYLKGFGIAVSTSGDNLMLNDQASVNFPDMYHNDWLVIHGLRSILMEPESEYSFLDDGDEF